MATAASVVINKVRNQLIDTGVAGVFRWTDAELLGWVGDGQRTMIAAAPRVSQITAVVPLVAGTRQTIPAGGYMYLAAYRNMGSSGSTPGPILLTTPRTLMDTQYPTWHQATAVAAPTLVIFDPSDPTAFYVSPPSDGTGKIELSYSVAAVDLTSTASNLVVQDLYQTPLFDYVMGRASQKDSDYSGGQAVAAQYMSAFMAFLTGLLKDPITATTQAGKD